MPPLGVSIVIPTYNRSRLVRRAVENVLAAVTADDEVIVVDDASTDDTPQVMATFDERVRYLRLPHGGAGVARNQGIAAATKPLVAFLDSDDEWMPGKLALQRAFMEARSDVLFCFSNFAVRLESGAEEHNYLINWHRDPRNWDEILAPGVPYSGIAELPAGWSDFRVHMGDHYRNELLGNYVITSTLVVRRVEAGQALHFAEDLATYEDKECFARLAGTGTAAYFDCETAWQHGHSGPRLTDANSGIVAAAFLKVLERVYQSDNAFMARHGDLVRRVIDEQRLARARWLIAHGDTAEARAELALCVRKPLSFRLLAALPGPVVTGLLGIRRLFQANRRA